MKAAWRQLPQMSGSNSEESVAPSIHPGGEYVGDVVMLSLFLLHIPD